MPNDNVIFKPNTNKILHEYLEQYANELLFDTLDEYQMMFQLFNDDIHTIAYPDIVNLYDKLQQSHVSEYHRIAEHIYAWALFQRHKDEFNDSKMLTSIKAHATHVITLLTTLDLL